MRLMNYMPEVELFRKINNFYLREYFYNLSSYLMPFLILLSYKTDGTTVLTLSKRTQTTQITCCIISFELN